MRIFQGPLGNHKNYIEFIAFPNCMDYFHLVANQQEQNMNKTPDKYQRLRIFLNALESFNNIPEYYFHEEKYERNWSNKELREILGKIRGKHRILQDIEQIVNAYKHCERHNPKQFHAKDLQNPNISISISGQEIKTNFNYDSMEDESIMEETFQFWKNYLDNHIELI